MIQLSDIHLTNLKNINELAYCNKKSEGLPATNFDQVLSNTIINNDAKIEQPKFDDQHREPEQLRQITDHQNKQPIEEQKKTEDPKHLKAEGKETEINKTDIRQNKKTDDEKKADQKDSAIENIQSKKEIKNDKETKLVKNGKHENKKNDLHLMLSALLDNMNKLIKELKEGNTENNKSEIKNMLFDLKKMLNNIKEGHDKILLSKTLNKLKSFVESLQQKMVGFNNSTKNQLLSTINTMINKLATSTKRIEHHDTSSNKITDHEIKNISTKIDAIIQNMSENSKNKSDMNDNSGNQQNLSFAKFDTGIKRAQNLTTNRPATPDFKEQMQTIMDRARISVRDNRNATFNIKLYPKELGHINVNLGLEHGVLHGKFIVDNMETRDLLQQNLAYLREELAQAGVEVGEFLVDVHDQRETFADDSTDNNQRSYTIENNEQKYQNQTYNNTAHIHSGSIDLVI